MKITKQIGKFWLPDSPWHRVYGEFELIKETLGRLLLFDVIDTFVSKAAYFNEHFQLMQHPLIIGKLKDGTGIALLQSSFRSISLNGYYEYNIDITVFTGPILIRSVEDLVFNKISFSFDQLHQYLGICIRERDYQQDPQSISVKYTPSKETFKICDSLECSFNYIYDYSFSSSLSTTQISSVTLIELESISSNSIRNWLDIIDKNIGAFFSIAIGKYLCPIRIKAIFEFESKLFKFNIFYRLFNNHNELSHNKRQSLQNMMPDLKDYLAAFYNFSTHYLLIIDNYLTLYKFDAILEYKFLSAVYSVESYSRYINQDHYFFSPEEFESNYYNPLTTYIKSKFSDPTNSDYINRLINSIKFSNELSLRALLTQIFNENKDIIDQIFSVNIDDLIAKIVDTRNWYTHFTKENEKSAAKGYELFELYIKIKVLFEICLFKQLKMQKEIIVQTIKNTYLLD